MPFLVQGDLELWTVRRTQDFLSVGKSSVYELIHRGRLRAFRPAGALRIDADSVRAYLASTEVR